MISLIGVGFILWDVGNTMAHGGKADFGSSDMVALELLLGAVILTSFIYALRKSKKAKSGSNRQIWDSGR